MEVDRKFSESFVYSSWWHTLISEESIYQYATVFYAAGRLPHSMMVDMFVAEKW
jgi:hypothetical protein